MRGFEAPTRSFLTRTEVLALAGREKCCVPPVSPGFLTKLLRLTIAYAWDWRQNLSNHMPAQIVRGYFGIGWVPGCP
jgi:hypothetical protein